MSNHDNAGISEQHRGDTRSETEQVSTYTRFLTSTETIRLIRDREKEGEGGMEVGEREIIYLSLHCHHQNDSCIKVGSNESHFNVS